jgi:hypothetical protein
MRLFPLPRQANRGHGATILLYLFVPGCPQWQMASAWSFPELRWPSSRALLESSGLSPLTVLQRAGRVERCRTTGGDEGGEQRDDGKDDRDGPERQGIVGLDVDQLAG